MLKPVLCKDGNVRLLDPNSAEYAEAVSSETVSEVSTKNLKANRGNMKEPSIDKRSDKSEPADDVE